MTDDLAVRFEWTFGGDQAGEARQLADELNASGGEAGLKPSPPNALAFIPIIAGAIGVLALAEAVVQFRRRRAEEGRRAAEALLGGWLVDSRSDPVTITRSIDVPYPTMIVIGKDGETTEIDNSLAETDETAVVADLLKAAIAAGT